MVSFSIKIFRSLQEIDVTNMVEEETPASVPQKIGEAGHLAINT